MIKTQPTDEPDREPPGDCSRPLERCRALLRDLEPDRPPCRAERDEYRWQYEALLERTDRYAALVARPLAPAQRIESNVRRAELALEVSLEYFERLLAAEPSTPSER